MRSALVVMTVLSVCLTACKEPALDRSQFPSLPPIKQVDQEAYYRGFRARANYDESKVPPYQLPELLTCLDGSKVSNQTDWETKRRPEILELFKEYMFGHSPNKPDNMVFQIRKRADNAFGGKALLKEVRIHFFGTNKNAYMDLLVLLPAQHTKPVPVFLVPNFAGNQSISDEKSISITDGWVDTKFGAVGGKATEATRGVRKSKWPIEYILSQGYGLATFHLANLDPDRNQYQGGVNFSDGIHPYFYEPGQTKPKNNEWGAMAAWSWGTSRGLDYLETDNDVDPNKVIVMGHSRLAKTALWTGAQDQRFAMVISNNSGCGGASLSRRIYGETIGKINQLFPHWYCENFKHYSLNEEHLPMDQHMLLALVAPRPLYVASAVDDQYADPMGEFLSAKHAQPVYRFYGFDDALHEFPKFEQPVMGHLGYHIRQGKHDVLLYDWQRYIEFANMHLKK